jgi:hypothetical protein
MFSITPYETHVGATVVDPDKPREPQSPWPALFLIGGIFALVGVTIYLQVKGKLPIYPPSPYGYGYGGYYGPPPIYMS